MIVEGKHGLKEEAVFDFKYVPNLGKVTKIEKARQRRVGAESSVERRNLSMVMIASMLLCLGLFFLWKLIVIIYTWSHVYSRSSLKLR